MPKLLKNWDHSQTVTIAELIAKLQEFPPAMAIAYTWEGQVLPVVLAEIEVHPDTDRVHGPVVLLDAET